MSSDSEGLGGGTETAVLMLVVVGMLAFVIGVAGLQSGFGPFPSNGPPPTATPTAPPPTSTTTTTTPATTTSATPTTTTPTTTTSSMFGTTTSTTTTPTTTTTSQFGTTTTTSTTSTTNTTTSTTATTTNSTTTNQPPTADFSAKRKGNTNQVELNADKSKDPDGKIVSYQWDIGDNGTIDATGQKVTANVPRGTPVKLIVTDDGGATDSTTKIVM